MAAIFVLAGGLVGFASAVVSFAVLGTGFLMALAIWSGVGLLAVVAGLAVSLAPRRLPAQEAEAQTV